MDSKRNPEKKDLFRIDLHGTLFHFFFSTETTASAVAFVVYGEFYRHRGEAQKAPPLITFIRASP
jgi:hypothetical protein